nr:hypothetical protein [Vibrio vulnificus]
MQLVCGNLVYAAFTP